MGHNLKTSYSDLAELEKEGIASIFGCNNSLEGNKSSEGESIVDLKLGNNFKQDHSHKAVSGMDPFSSPPGSSRRARTPSVGAPVVSCLVDGCKSDLSKCRDYHRRHKVCEMHSKTPRVTIAGHEQRFCQQCSRFHSLGEFDEGKRSCRKRLEGHNRRRRKPQPEPLLVNQENFLSTSQGTRYLPFNNQQMIAASSVVGTTWSGGIKPESNTALYSTSSVSGSYSHDHHAYRGRQFPFLQAVDDPNSASGNGGGSSSTNNNNNDGPKIYCDGLNQVIDSDRALSLLSSSPAEMGLGRVIHPNPINPARPMTNGLHYNSIGQYLGPQGPGLEGQPGGPALFSNFRSSSNSLCQDVFQGGPDGSSPSGGHHQTLSFSWE